MARDRKRAKQRRDRRAGRTQPSLAATKRPTTEPPEPQDEASAYAEEAKVLASSGPAEDRTAAQEALGRPEEAEVEERPERPQRVGELGDGAAAPERPAPREGSRFANFLRACWAELQRVQWPDRRQVAQATGVVLGFVVIAGGYLGLMDAIFSRVVEAIL